MMAERMGDSRRSILYSTSAAINGPVGRTMDMIQQPWLNTLHDVAFIVKDAKR